MARVEIWETVIDTDGVPVSGQDVYVYDARTTDETTVWEDETDPATLPQPLSTTNGKIEGWVEEGEYDLVIGADTQRFNAVIGGLAITVDTSDIADDAITADKIAAGAVGTSEIATDGVGTAEIVAGAVDTAELADNAVTNVKVADDAIDSAEIVDGAIDRVHLAADIVDGTKIADDSIDSEHYVDGSIDTVHIASGAVTTGRIELGTYLSDSSGATNPLAVGYQDTGTQVTVTADGLWLILSSGYVTCNFSGSDTYQTFKSVLLADATPLCAELQDTRLIGASAGTILIPFTHATIAEMATSDVIKHRISSPTTSALIGAGDLILRAIRISG